MPCLRHRFYTAVEANSRFCLSGWDLQVRVANYYKVLFFRDRLGWGGKKGGVGVRRRGMEKGEKRKGGVGFEGIQRVFLAKPKG